MSTGTADLNVPMFIALRRFTLLCTVILERSMLHKQHDRATMGAVGLMIGGMFTCMHMHNNLRSRNYDPLLCVSYAQASAASCTVQMDLKLEPQLILCAAVHTV